MPIRERIEQFWSGEAPDRIPYTIYQNEWRHVQDDPAWNAMLADGLGITWHVPTFEVVIDNVETHETTANEQGKVVRRRTRKTPVGEITEEWADGWQQQYAIKTAADYRVMTYIVKHSQIRPRYDRFQEMDEKIGPHGIPLVMTGRTPLQTILVDYVGLENFAFHLFDFAAEVQELYEALLAKFRRIVDITAAGPGRFVSVLENFTAETLGPQRFAAFHLPVYEECFPILQAAGKIVGTHYDGRLASCSDWIAKAPIDLIESLTEPPEGDLSLSEARRIWPNKLFWVNIRVSDYNLPPQELTEHVLSLVDQAAVEGAQLAFEVSEHLPVNWKESMPVVLQALNNDRRR